MLKNLYDEHIDDFATCWLNYCYRKGNVLSKIIDFYEMLGILSIS